jgi:hypothetical protein
MIDLKLGILYNKGIIVNHRSLIKVLLNPVLRKFGLYIGTPYNRGKNKLGFIVIKRCKKSKTIKWDFDSYNEFDFIEKRRILL